MAIPRVEWRPSPYYNPRQRAYPLKGDVSHRIVGNAPSALGSFGAPGGSHTSSRQASAHFIIGHRNGRNAAGQAIFDALCPQCGSITGARGPLVIYQCVDLANMAWANGDIDQPTWPGYQPGVNPNLTTISTEHEDQASAGHHIVTEHIWNASMELKKLLRSGDLNAIKAAGVRVSNGAFTSAELVARMASLPISGATYTDHHAIAGKLKQFCWRDYDEDKGFPRRLPGLLAYLEGGDAMDWHNDITRLNPSENWTLRAGCSYRVSPDLSPESKPVVLNSETTRTIFGMVKGQDFGAGPDWGVMVSESGGLKTVHTQDIVKRVLLTEGGGGADCSAQEAIIKQQAQRIADLQTALGQRDAAITKKNAGLDAAIAHEKPHVSMSQTLTAARSA